jgi:hypothetical protein
MYREWADLHHKNAESHSQSALASDRLAEEFAHKGLVVQAAANRAHAKQSRRIGDHYRLMEAKYRRASRCPWSAIPDDPGPPDMCGPLTVDL